MKDVLAPGPEEGAHGDKGENYEDGPTGLFLGDFAEDSKHNKVTLGENLRRAS